MPDGAGAGGYSASRTESTATDVGAALRNALNFNFNSPFTVGRGSKTETGAQSQSASAAGDDDFGGGGMKPTTLALIGGGILVLMVVGYFLFRRKG
jgi:hypothetical protein